MYSTINPTQSTNIQAAGLIFDSFSRIVDWFFHIESTSLMMLSQIGSFCTEIIRFLKAKKFLLTLRKFFHDLSLMSNNSRSLSQTSDKSEIGVLIDRRLVQVSFVKLSTHLVRASWICLASSEYISN